MGSRVRGGGGANPMPAISVLVPATIERWDPATDVEVNGTGFVPTSVVYAGAVALATLYVSAVKLIATFPESVFYTNGTISVTVVSPGPGGGTSNVSSLTVSQPSTYILIESNPAIVSLNGANVASLPDQSGRGDATRNFTQSTPAAQPPWVETDAAYNGNATLTGDGARNMITGTWAPAPAKPYLYVLVGHNATAGVASYIVDGLTAPKAGGILRLSSGVTQLYAGTVQTVAGNMATPGIHVAKFDGVNSAWARNAKTLVTTGGTTGTHTIAGLTLGSAGGGTLKFTGSIAYLMAFDATLVSAAKLGRVIDGFSLKFGIAVGP